MMVESSQPSELMPTPTVLVVDDEALIRWSLSEALTEAGFPVSQASTGAEAVATLLGLGDGPLVVVLDLRLPDVKGLSLMRDIRRVRPDAPVIMMTAFGTPDDASEAQAAGVFAFAGKPFDVTEMIGLVRSAWDARVDGTHGIY